jgi:hypothetical protein
MPRKPATPPAWIESQLCRLVETAPTQPANRMQRPRHTNGTLSRLARRLGVSPMKVPMPIKVNQSQSVMRLFGAIATLWLTTYSAHAFTCEDVRRLTAAQQNYYATLFHISAPQRHQIWVACYLNYRADRTRVAVR